MAWCFCTDLSLMCTDQLFSELIWIKCAEVVAPANKVTHLEWYNFKLNLLDLFMFEQIRPRTNLATHIYIHINPAMRICQGFLTRLVYLKHMGGSEKFWFYWRTKKYRAGVHKAEGTPCLYHACSKEDGGLAVGSAVKCRKAIFAYVAKRKSSSCTWYVCWNRVKKKKKKKIFDFESLVLQKFRIITAISHPCKHDI